MDMIFAPKSHFLYSTCANFYPQAILLDEKTHFQLGMRFIDKDSKIFIDIAIPELQELFDTKAGNIDDIIKDSRKSLYRIFSFFPAGLPYQYCNIDMNVVSNIKIAYLNSDFTPVNPKEFISFAYPCCIIRLKRDKTNDHFVEHLYAVNRTIYNTDFIKRFNIDGPISIYSISNSNTVLAVCSTRYFDMNIEDTKYMEDFNKEVKEFRNKYAIPSGLDIAMISKDSKIKVVIIPKRKELKLGETICKTTSLTLPSDAIVKYSSSLSMSICGYNNNPVMYILPSFNKDVITVKPKRPPVGCDYKATMAVVEMGYMNTRYVLTGENEFTIVPECHIEPYTDDFVSIYNELIKVLEKEDVGIIIEDMKTGKIEISRRVSVDNKGIAFIFQVNFPIDYNAFGEKNREYAYKILKNRFIRIKRNTCNRGSCKNAEDEFCFEFKVFKKKEESQ